MRVWETRHAQRDKAPPIPFLTAASMHGALVGEPVFAVCMFGVNSPVGPFVRFNSSFWLQQTEGRKAGTKSQHAGRNYTQMFLCVKPHRVLLKCKKLQKGLHIIFPRESCSCPSAGPLQFLVACPKHSTGLSTQESVMSTAFRVTGCTQRDFW